MPGRIGPKMSADAFEQVVRDVVSTIPKPLQDRLDNVEILIADWPTRAELREAGVADGYTLYGLYTGVPLTERTSSYGMVLPDRITIYRGPLVDACETEDELREEIRGTVIHEFAHFFGLSDDDLRRLGVY